MAAPTRWRRGLIISGVVIALIVAIAGFEDFYTPTTRMYVDNDTSIVVELMSCGDDPATLQPGQTVYVDQRPNDPHSACNIVTFDGQMYLGCLLMPTTRFHSGQSFKVSRMTKTISSNRCGD